METDANSTANTDGQSSARADVTARVMVRALVRDVPTLLACLFLLAIVVSAIFAPLLAPHDAFVQNIALRNRPPLTPALDGGFPHLFGTDALGRDVFSRLMHGSRVSLSVGFASVLASGAIGVLLGLISGYYRGRVDDAIMRVVDVFLGFPTLLLALFVLFVIGPGFTNLVLVLALTRWMVYARITRGMTMSYRESPFVEGAIAIGCRDVRVITRHILPHLRSPILIFATLEFASLILAEAALSFLGLGIQPPAASWGLEVAAGREYIVSAWWLVTIPGFIILLTTLSLNLLAGWFRAVSDPTQRWRSLSGESSSATQATVEKEPDK